MNTTYDPLKDPAADGFVDLSQSPTKVEWKATSQSALNEANAAPDASASERKGMSMMLKCSIFLALAFAVFWAGKVHFTKKYEDHEARVSSIKTQPSGSPEIGASPTGKRVTPPKPVAKPSVKAPESATQNIATQAINTPAMPSFEAEKQHGKTSGLALPSALALPSNPSPAQLEFNRNLEIFKGNIK